MPGIQPSLQLHEEYGVVMNFSLLSEPRIFFFSPHYKSRIFYCTYDTVYLFIIRVGVRVLPLAVALILALLAQLHRGFRLGHAGWAGRRWALCRALDLGKLESVFLCVAVLAGAPWSLL